MDDDNKHVENRCDEREQILQLVHAFFDTRMSLFPVSHRPIPDEIDVCIIPCLSTFVFRVNLDTFVLYSPYIEVDIKMQLRSAHLTFETYITSPLILSQCQEAFQRELKTWYANYNDDISLVLSGFISEVNNVFIILAYCIIDPLFDK